MPRKSMDTTSIRYGDLYDDDARYIIPRFQRDYNWKADHVDEFWNDLIEHWKNWKEKKDRVPYYFGSVMLINEKEEDSTFRVVDGQQRITTSMIFFIVLRDYFLEHEKDDDVEELDSIIYYEDDNKQLKPRLQLNRYNNPYFEDKIIIPDKITAKESAIGRGIKVKDRDLVSCYKQIAKKLEQDEHLDLDQKEKLNQLRDLYNHLLEKFHIIQNIFSSKQRAYRIFETINRKGLHLDENDLVKNFLMELIDETDSIEESQEIIDADDKWGSIIEKLEEVKIKEDFFLRIHLTAFFGKTPKDKIYDNISKRIKDKTQAWEFLNELEKSAEFLSKIKKAETADWNSDLEIIDNLNGLNALSDGGMYPILLAANKKLKPEEMKKLIELVTKLHFRAKTVCGLSYTSVEGLVVKICEQLTKPADYSVSDIQNEMLSWSQYPNDDEFEVKFNKLELSSPDKAKYVLMEIEYSKTGERSTTSRPIAADIQVEHIMPKSIAGDWNDELKMRPDLDTPAKISDYHKRNLKRLGNLTLLSPTANAIIQNDSYQKKLRGNEKYRGYCNDTLKITSSLENYKQWDEAAMTAREKDFYYHAKEIWNLKS